MYLWESNGLNILLFLKQSTIKKYIFKSEAEVRISTDVYYLHKNVCKTYVVKVETWASAHGA